MDRDLASADARRLEEIGRIAAALRDDPRLRAACAAALAPSTGIEVASLAALIEAWPRGLDCAAYAIRLGQLRADGRPRPRQVALIAPGNLPVAAWTAIVELLLLGARVRVRPGAGDPDGPAVLRQLLATHAPALAAAVEICAVARGDGEGWRALAAGCDAAVVFGGDAAVATVAALLRAAGLRGPVRGHGHKVSLALAEGGALTGGRGPEAAARLDALLRAALLADGRGCLSLRALLLRGDRATAAATVQRLGDRAAAVAAALPAGALAAELVAARRLAVEEAHLLAAIGVGAVAAGPDWAIGWDGAIHATVDAAAIGPGARWLPVLPLAEGVTLASALAPLRGHLACLAVSTDAALSDAALYQDALAAGFDRLCLPDDLQAPPWHAHDGVPAGAGLGC